MVLSNCNMFSSKSVVKLASVIYIMCNFSSCTMYVSFLFFAQHLRAIGVVGKFVEFFGEGVSQLSIADRATIANMCPEYGATVGYFPIDVLSLNYLRQTGDTFHDLEVSSYCCLSFVC